MTAFLATSRPSCKIMQPAFDAQEAAVELGRQRSEQRWVLAALDNKLSRHCCIKKIIITSLMVFFYFYILILDSNGAALADLLSKNYRSRVPPSKILIFADG